jgi:CRISPR system Cascade subunit CasE
MGFFESAELPGGATEKRLSRNILFRVDETSSGKIILVRSDVPPTNLPREGKTKLTDGHTPGEATAVRFRLTANAVHRSRPGDPSLRRGKGTTPVADISEWVTSRLSVAFDDITVFNHDRTVATSGKAPLQLDVVDGYAIVKNHAALEILLRDGVGRSKAFGCGLLTVARA